MVEAEIRGKLGDEDRLTSAAFGLLSYLPDELGLLALLKAAKPVRKKASDLLIRPDPGWLDLHSIDSVSIAFWSRLGQHGEPDIVLDLRESSRLRHLVVIEVKLDSAKSGSAAEDSEPFQEEVIDPDQIVKYWQAVSGRAKRERDRPSSSIIYLTSHPVPPRKELRESIERAGDDMRLAWLSWHDVWRIARPAADVYRPANDLRRLLDALGFKTFEGFASDVFVPEAQSGFWTHPRWFAHKTPESFGASFWRS